jgi:hypothetical protein
MTPHELEIREEHFTTADLAKAANRDGAALPMTGDERTERAEPLFSPNDSQGFRSRWEKIQIGFVDEPRNAVKQADELVAGTIKRLAEVFAAERQKLEAEWDNNDNVSTEDLRVALRRYRSFFDRLLSV